MRLYCDFGYGCTGKLRSEVLKFLVHSLLHFDLHFLFSWNLSNFLVDHAELLMEIIMNFLLNSDELLRNHKMLAIFKNKTYNMLYLQHIILHYYMLQNIGKHGNYNSNYIPIINIINLYVSTQDSMLSTKNSMLSILIHINSLHIDALRCIYISNFFGTY